MKYPLLSRSDLNAIDALKEHHGGAQNIIDTLRERRRLETRKRVLEEKGFGGMIADAEQLVERFPKIEDFEKNASPAYRDDLGIATAQVSGFQGAAVTHRSMQRMAESADSDEPCWVPSEFISVVALTENYVYSGDLMATLAMAENIMGASKFCSTNLIGIPMPARRFAELEKLTGKTFEIRDLGDGMAQRQPPDLPRWHHPRRARDRQRLFPQPLLVIDHRRLLLRARHPQSPVQGLDAAVHPEPDAVPDAPQHHARVPQRRYDQSHPGDQHRQRSVG